MFSQETIRTTIGVLTLAAAATGLYVGSQTQQAATAARVTSLEVEVGKLDQYDIQLQRQADETRESLVRVETLMLSSEKNYDRLTTTMDNLGVEIRNLSDALIRTEIKNVR
jgi:predicted  nucleic acid-binding Zn-ribbon protein